MTTAWQNNGFNDKLAVFCGSDKIALKIPLYVYGCSISMCAPFIHVYGTLFISSDGSEDGEYKSLFLKYDDYQGISLAWALSTSYWLL